jgi:hypothetical protein
MEFPFRKPRQDEPREATFPELVFTHFLRQRELYAAAQQGAPSAERALHGPAEDEYRHCLAAFTRRHGQIVDAYWCTHEISGVALTEKPRWGWRGLWPHRDIVTRLHQATDWSTKNAQPIAAQLHACESLAIRANEVLLGTSERIVMQLLLALAGRLLAVVDRDEPPAPGLVREAVEESRKQLAEIRSYYDRAGQKAVRVFYVGGMLVGLSMLTIGILLALAAGAGHNVVVALGMGGAGAVVSVLSRMASRDGRFNLDHEVGQKEARRLGTFRPMIGATFGLLIYLAVSAQLVQFAGELSPKDRTIAFYAVIAFLAGFSERWAKVVLDVAPPEKPEAKPEPKPEPQPAPERQAGREEQPEPAVPAPTV